MKFKRRSGGNEIILPNGAAKQSSAVQESLAAGVARGHRWLQLLEEGKFDSLSEFAEAVGMDSSQLRRHLNLTLLGPDIVRGRAWTGWSLRGCRWRLSPETSRLRGEGMVDDCRHESGPVTTSSQSPGNLWRFFLSLWYQRLWVGLTSRMNSTVHDDHVVPQARR